ncbi:MAG: hypothetical protein M3R06_00745 [Chloroflexota bacterium]|nr:hypothetical protein [Chloroflexota bacterium]
MPSETPAWFVGLDLGQAHDFSAIVAVERTGPRGHRLYETKVVERLPLGLRYPLVVAEVRPLIDYLQRLVPRPAVTLCLDYTGVGRAVADLFVAADLGVPLCPITITGGDTITPDGNGWRVPKRELASVVAVLLQTGRLRFASALPLVTVLTEELLNFRVRIAAASGHDSYGAGQEWRERNHDDLVLALSMALWRGQRDSDRRVTVSSYLAAPEDDYVPHGTYKR